jgi:CheY-like chemotaxis protein
MTLENTEKKAVLIVDDSLLSRKKLGSLIDKDKYRAATAKDGREAVEKIGQEQYDVILLDLLMPGMTGFEVLEYMKENNIGIPAIVVSADIQETTKEKCLSLGAVNFLNKPPQKEALNNAINEAIEK